MKKTDSKILGITNSNEKSDYKYVGALLPPRTNNFITLYSLAMKINKSNLFKSLIDDWMNYIRNHENHNENTLMKEIAKRAKNSWLKHSKAHPKASYDIFRDSLTTELMNKGLSMNQVTTILNLVNGKTKK